MGSLFEIGYYAALLESAVCMLTATDERKSVTYFNDFLLASSSLSSWAFLASASARHNSNSNYFEC